MLRIDSLKKAKARKQAGFVVTVELLLITVIMVVGLVTGMTKLRDQTIAELSDTGSAIGSINQSYGVMGTTWSAVAGPFIAETQSWNFLDAEDAQAGSSVGGDTQNVVYNSVFTAGSAPANDNQDEY